MRRNLIILFFTLLWQTSFASYVPEHLDSLIQASKNNIYSLKFQQAEQICLDMRVQYPDYPHGYVLQAYITVLVYSMDQSNPAVKKRLDIQVKKALAVSGDYKDRNKENPDSYFQLALSHGIQAVYHVVNRSFIWGFLSGKRSKSNLEKVVKLDSTYYDAYFGIGLFHYYSDLLPGIVKVFAGIFGFSGDRLLGKKEIASTATKGKHYKVEAEFLFHNLSYFLEGEEKNSVLALKNLYKDFPENQAMGLILAYHYRRIGCIQTCIDYCNKLTDKYSNFLPQLTNLRYYNLGICYFTLNNFPKADSIFTIMENLPTRKSKFYLSGLYYYRGLLSDLQYDRDTALNYYQKIENHKQSNYWFWSSQMLKKYPADSLFAAFFCANNLLGSRQVDSALVKTLNLKAQLDAGRRGSNPDLKFLITDLLARTYFARRQYQPAIAAYQEIVPKLDKMDDKFRRSWIYIHYSRALRMVNEFDHSQKMLKKAGNNKDNYTRIIIKKEKFILQQQKKQFNWSYSGQRPRRSQTIE